MPYRFDRTDTAADLHEKWADLPPGVETGETASVAGRLMLRRDQGKVAFGTLADSSGRIQLFARAGETPRFDEFAALSLGDWIGVTGEVMTTRRGELSVKVDDWVRAGRHPPPVPRQVARPHRPRHPLPPALRRPVRHRPRPATPSSCAAGW